MEDILKDLNECCKKYSLGSFEELNKEFDIGKIEKNSGVLVRDIRRAMIEKIVHYIRLGELIISPTQASPVFLVLMREITAEDKKAIDEMFRVFVALEMKSYKYDLDFSEKNEAELIREIYNSWKNSKPYIRNIIKAMERNWGNNQVRKERAYFS